MRSARPKELYQVIEIDHISKTFSGTRGLDDVSIRIEPGEMVALIGSSGSGKSTLIRHICGLSAADRDRGSIRVNGHIVQEKGVISSRIRSIRSQIGVIFQQFNLVDRMSVFGNVCLGALHRTPLWRSLTGLYSREVCELAQKSLARVGILDKAAERTSNLSGGQQQRAAIARALVQKASVLLADEPIASLDPATSQTVMQILRDLNEKDGLTVLVSLHQVDYALNFCRRTIALRSGRVVYDEPSAALTSDFLKKLYGGSDLIMSGSGMPADDDDALTGDHCAA